MQTLLPPEARKELCTPNTDTIVQDWVLGQQHLWCSNRQSTATVLSRVLPMASALEAIDRTIQQQQECDTVSEN